MNPVRIHEIAVSCEGDHALVAEEEKGFKVKGNLWVYDLRARQLRCQIPVRYDMGGQRIAASTRHGVCIVGCYEAYGIAAYSLDGGKELWRRKDLKAVQELVLLSDGGLIFCGREKRAAHILDTKTGTTVMECRGVNSAYAAQTGHRTLLAGRKFEVHDPPGKTVMAFKLAVERETTAAFSPSEIVISAGDAVLFGMDGKSGNLVWKTQEKPGYLFNPVCYDQDARCFISVLRRYKDKTDPVRKLVFFEGKEGHAFTELAIGTAAQYAFCLNGKALFSSSLELISCGTGEVIHAFVRDPIPESRYARLSGEEFNSLGKEYVHMLMEGVSGEEAKRNFVEKMVEQMREKKSSEGRGDNT